MGYYYKEDEPMVTCQQIYIDTNSRPISVDLTRLRWTLLGHILRRSDQNIPAYRAMKQYFKLTLPGADKKRKQRRGRRVTSTMEMINNEFQNAETIWHNEIGINRVANSKDFTKLTNYAMREGRRMWTRLSHHIAARYGIQWIKNDSRRKKQRVPWNTTPILGLMGSEQREEQRQRQQQLQQHREHLQQQQRLTRGAEARNREAILPIMLSFTE